MKLKTLRLKKDFNLKELKKCGLFPKYNEYTGEIQSIESYRSVGVLKQRTLRTIFYKNGKNYILDEKCNYDSIYEYMIDADVIYELTKNNLIEKV